MATSQQALVAQLQGQLDSVDVDNLDKHTRLQACDLAHQLWLRLEQPGDLVDRIIFQVICRNQQPELCSCLHFCSLKKML